MQLPADAALAFKEALPERMGDIRWDKDANEFEKRAFETILDTFPGNVIDSIEALGSRDATRSPALVLQGLPMENTLPMPTGETPIAREEQVIEALLFGIGRFLGHAMGLKEMTKLGLTRDLLTKKGDPMAELTLHRCVQCFRMKYISCCKRLI